jgi:hypothetical protein
MRTPLKLQGFCDLQSYKTVAFLSLFIGNSGLINEMFCLLFNQLALLLSEPRITHVVTVEFCFNHLLTLEFILQKQTVFQRFFFQAKQSYGIRAQF